MAKNRMKCVVEVELGDANRLIKFDLNAICDLEDFFKKPVSKIFDEERGIALTEVRGTMWVGLRRFHDGGELLLTKVGDWLQEAFEEGRFEEVSGQLGEALSLALVGPEPETKGESGKNSKPPKTGAKKGSTSRSSSNKPDASE